MGFTGFLLGFTALLHGAACLIVFFPDYDLIYCVLPGFTGFLIPIVSTKLGTIRLYWVSTWFYRNLPSFTGFLSALNWFVLNNTGFDKVLLGLTGSYWVFTRFYWVLLGFSGFCWIMIRFYRVLPSCTGFYWVLLGFPGFGRDWMRGWVGGGVADGVALFEWPLCARRGEIGNGPIASLGESTPSRHFWFLYFFLSVCFFFRFFLGFPSPRLCLPFYFILSSTRNQRPWSPTECRFDLQAMSFFFDRKLGKTR